MLGIVARTLPAPRAVANPPTASLNCPRQRSVPKDGPAGRGRHQHEPYMRWPTPDLAMSRRGALGLLATGVAALCCGCASTRSPVAAVEPEPPIGAADPAARELLA